MTRIAALDVGGANLKLADGQGLAISEPFALWQRPKELTDALVALLRRAPDAERVALTMTGELADCYETKSQGVAAIVAATQRAVELVGESRAAGLESHASTSSEHAASSESDDDEFTGPVEVWVYAVGGEWLTPAQASAKPLAVAASNWHALASFAGRFFPEGSALCLDVGSTTSDVIPLVGGLPVAIGGNDPERMAVGELVYTGVVRTPLAMVCPAVPWRRRFCPTAHELFATMLDVYLLLDEIAEDETDVRTADGRPATKRFAWDRIARSICADREMFSYEEAVAAARNAAQHQERLLLAAAQDVARRFDAPFGGIVVSGQGAFLAARVAAKLQSNTRVVSLTEALGPTCSAAAPAHALAVLAREGWGL